MTLAWNASRAGSPLSAGGLCSAQRPRVQEALEANAKPLLKMEYQKDEEEYNLQGLGEIKGLQKELNRKDNARYGAAEDVMASNKKRTYSVEGGEG